MSIYETFLFPLGNFLAQELRMISKKNEDTTTVI